jgi:hypothetical protein
MNKNHAQKIQQIADGFKSADPQTAPTSKPLGRPKTGKSSNPDFRNVTVYILDQTYKDIHHLIVDTKPRLDFSDVTQIALAEWLERQKAKTPTD